MKRIKNYVIIQINLEDALFQLLISALPQGVFPWGKVMLCYVIPLKLHYTRFHVTAIPDDPSNVQLGGCNAVIEGSADGADGDAAEGWQPVVLAPEGRCAV